MTSNKKSPGIYSPLNLAAFSLSFLYGPTMPTLVLLAAKPWHWAGWLPAQSDSHSQCLSFAHVAILTPDDSLLLKVCAFSSCCRRACSNPALLRETGMVRDFLSAAAAPPAPSWLLQWGESAAVVGEVRRAVRKSDLAWGWLLSWRKGNERPVNDRWIIRLVDGVAAPFNYAMLPSAGLLPIMQEGGPGQPHYPQYNFAAVLQVRRQSKDRKG